MGRWLIVLGALALSVVVGLAAVVVAVVRRFGRRRAPVQPERPERPERTRAGRLMLLAAPALVGAGVVFMLVIGAPWLLARQHFPVTPKQPIAFDHQIHVEQVGLNCAFCHRTANEGTTAGLPDVQQCMFCHTVVDSAVAAPRNSGQIQQVRAAWTDQQVIDWVRIHHVPDHSRFPHDAHVSAGVPCSTCHGDVGRMSQVAQVRSLKMGDCVACHQETQAPVQCGACHY